MLVKVEFAILKFLENAINGSWLPLTAFGRAVHGGGTSTPESNSPSPFCFLQQFSDLDSDDSLVFCYLTCPSKFDYHIQ